MKTRDTIIKDAFRKIGIPGDSGTLTTDQLNAGVSAFSSLVKTYHNIHGMPLWKTNDYIWNFDLFSAGYSIIGIGELLDVETVPLKMINAWRVDLTDATKPKHVPMDLYTRREFNSINQPNQLGTPQVAFPLIAKDKIVLRVWPEPDANWTTNGAIQATVITEFDPMEAGDDLPDFPSHWEDALIYGLASRLAPEYGYGLSDREVLNRDLKVILDAALLMGNEEGSVFIRPQPNHYKT